MIDLIVRDFQSIEEAKIRVKGLTLILGESSAGKSAFLRAVHAAMNNRFKSGHVRWGSDHATVMVRTPESKDILTVTRPWSGSISMKLGNQVLSKIGRTLPKDVSDFLNLASITVDNDKYSLNFHDQFQKPLLLEFSQKKVMDILSASASLDDLNLLKDFISEKKSQNKGAFSAVDAILNEAKENLSNTKARVVKYSDKIARLKKLSEELSSLESLNSDINELQNAFKDLFALQSRSVSLQELINKCDLYNALSQQECCINQLQELLDSLNKNNKGTVLYEKLLSSIELNKVDLLSNIETLESFINNLKEVNKHIADLESVIEVYSKIFCIEDTRETLSRTLSDLEHLESLLNSKRDLDTRIHSLNEIVEKNICPICGSHVKTE